MRSCTQVRSTCCTKQSAQAAPAVSAFHYDPDRDLIVIGQREGTVQRYTHNSRPHDTHDRTTHDRTTHATARHAHARLWDSTEHDGQVVLFGDLRTEQVSHGHARIGGDAPPQGPHPPDPDGRLQGLDLGPRRHHWRYTPTTHTDTHDTRHIQGTPDDTHT
jgi:hypothetical protein